MNARICAKHCVFPQIAQLSGFLLQVWDELHVCLLDRACWWWVLVGCCCQSGVFLEGAVFASSLRGVESLQGAFQGAAALECCPRFFIAIWGSLLA